MVSIYMHASIGHRGPNVTKLAQLTSWLGMLSAPWVVMGDWSMDPAQLAATKVFDRLDCRLLAPEGADITCVRGQGALLDYALHADAITWVMGEAAAVYDAPWATHLPVTFTINRKTPAVRIRELQAPFVTALPRLSRGRRPLPRRASPP